MNTTMVEAAATVMDCSLADEYNIRVRFNEVDSYHIVWHGHYINYFEQGRESFGRRFGVSYDLMKAEGTIAPIIRVEADYRRSLTSGDEVKVVTTYVSSPAAKICFQYEIQSLDGNLTYCRGYSEQVLLEADTQRLYPTAPTWFVKWQSKWLA